MLVIARSWGFKSPLGHTPKAPESQRFRGLSHALNRGHVLTDVLRAFEQALERLDGFLLHSGQDVAVQVEGDADCGVP